MEAATLDRTAAFPEDWDAPSEGNLTYRYDPMHFPYPISPLTLSTHRPAFGAGFGQAAQELNIPIKRVVVLDRNFYRFEAHEMDVPASPEEGHRMGEAAEASVKAEIGRLLERWNEEHLPALRAHIARLREIDVDTPPAGEVARTLDEVDAIHRDLWLIHFRVALPMLVAIQLFDEFYADLFGPDANGHALLVGVESESVKAGLALYDLAVRARGLGLESVFQETPAGRLLDVLGESESGRSFVADLNAYLEQYGLRQDLFDLGTPTWQENPTIALSTVRSYLQSGRDERAAYGAKQQAAEDALAVARAELAAYPEAIRGQFEALLGIGRAGSFLQEEHNFYIDQQGLALVRLFYVQVGNRLVREGVLDAPDDIFLLYADEIKSLFANPSAEGQVDHVRSLVQTRGEQLKIAETLTPPPFIGPPPQEPQAPDNPMNRSTERFFGGPPQQAEASNQIKGNAGSRGTVTGVARVVRSLEEAASLQPGEILVATTTMPPWTPLFAVAAAVVTETGGPLSHCAIVAREYGIPAVVGAHGATKMIVSGQRITVDGGRGIVTIDD